MKALSNRKKLMAIVLVLLVASGMVAFITLGKNKVAEETTNTIERDENIQANDICYGTDDAPYFEMELVEAKTPGREKLYSNLTAELTFEVKNFKNIVSETSNYFTSYWRNKIYFDYIQLDDGSDEDCLNNYDLPSCVRRTGWNQSPAFKISSTWRERETTNITNGRCPEGYTMENNWGRRSCAKYSYFLKIQLNGEIKDENTGLGFYEKRVTPMTYNVRFAVAGSKCKNTYHSVTIPFEMNSKYYDIAGNIEKRTNFNNNPNNEENRWDYTFTRLDSLNKYNVNQITVKILDERGVDRTDRFDVEKVIPWGNNSPYFIIKNYTDNRRPSAGKYKLVLHYENDDLYNNGSTSRDEDPEKLVLEYPDAIEIGARNIQFESVYQNPEVRSYRYRNVQEGVAEPHTLTIHSINGDMVDWTETFTDINHGDNIERHYTRTKTEFTNMYATYGVDIGAVRVDATSGLISMPLASTTNQELTDAGHNTTACYKANFKNGDSKDASYYCINKDGTRKNYIKKGDTDTINVVTYTCPQEEPVVEPEPVAPGEEPVPEEPEEPKICTRNFITSNDKSRLKASEYSPADGRKIVSHSVACEDNYTCYTYEYVFTFNKTKPIVETETVMNTPIVSNGGEYNFRYRFRDLSASDILNARLRIISKATGQEIPENTIFRIIWPKTQAEAENIIRRQVIDFKIKYLEEDYPVSGEIINMREGGYYLSIEMPGCEEVSAPFAINAGELDFYVQSSVDKQESTNPLQGEYPPGNSNYQWIIGFFLMRDGSQVKSKSGNNISVHIYDRQARLIPEKIDELLDENGKIKEGQSIDIDDLYFVDSVNYTIDVINYSDGNFMFNVVETPDNRYEQEVQLFNNVGNDVAVFTEARMRSVYGDEVVNLLKNYFTYGDDGGLLPAVHAEKNNKNITILRMEQTTKEVPVMVEKLDEEGNYVLDDDGYPIMVPTGQTMEVPGDTYLYYEEKDLSTGTATTKSAVLIDPASKQDFASLYPEIYLYVAKYLQFVEDPENPNISYPVSGRISGTREAETDINGNFIKGHEVTSQFKIEADVDHAENTERAVEILPKVEVNPGVYYVYVGSDSLYGAGYKYNRDKGAISPEDYPEMMGVNIHEARLEYVEPIYKPRLQSPISSNSGNDQDRMYYNADSQSQVMLELGDIKYITSGQNGVNITPKYEYLPYNKVCPVNQLTGEFDCTGIDNAAIDASTEWIDITDDVSQNNQYITIDVESNMNDLYVFGGQERTFDERTPYITVRNKENCSGQDCEFSPRGYYRITWDYKKSYERCFAIPGDSNHCETYTVQGLSETTSYEYDENEQVVETVVHKVPSVVISNVAKFYGITLQDNDEAVTFIHNFQTTKIVDGQLSYIANPKNIVIGGKFTNKSGQEYQLIGENTTVIDANNNPQEVKSLKYIDVNGDVVDELKMQYTFQCKYGDVWEDCVDVQTILNTAEPDSPEYIKYKPYEYGVQSQDFRIILQNTKNYQTKHMITPEGNYDVVLSYTEVDNLPTYEEIENATPTVSDEFSIFVDEDSFNFLITNTKAVFTETDQYIELNVQTQYINEDDLDYFTANVYALDKQAFEYVDDISGDSESNAIFRTEEPENPLIEWKEHEEGDDENIFEGVLRVHINKDRIDDLDTGAIYKFVLTYGDTGRSYDSWLDMDELLSWGIYEEYPIISGEYPKTNGGVIPLDKFYSNVEQTNIDLLIYGPHNNNVNVIITSDCSTLQCNPNTVTRLDSFNGSAGSTNGTFFNIVNNSGDSGEIKLIYHYRADTSGNVQITPGDYQIILYYSETDYKVVPFTVEQDFIKIQLTGTKNYTTVNGVNHNGLYINKSGTIYADAEIYGVALSDITFEMYNANGTGGNLISKNEGRAFKLEYEELTASPSKLKIKFDHTKGLTTGDYVLKFIVGTREIAPEVVWADDEDQTVNDELLVTIKDRYFDFDFSSVEYDPDPLYPNATNGGKITLNVTTDEIVTASNSLDQVRQAIVNNLSIVNPSGSTVTRQFNITSSNTGSTSFKIVIRYPKNGVTAGTYVLRTQYTNDVNNVGTTITRKKNIVVDDVINFFTLISSKINSKAYDGLLHKNLLGDITVRFATEYPYNRNYLTYGVYDTNNNNVSQHFIYKLNGTSLKVSYDFNGAGQLDAGEYIIRLNYTENPLHPVTLDVPFTMNEAYNSFEIYGMETDSAIIYADASGQEYSFMINDEFFSEEEKGLLKARVYNDVGVLVYSDFESDIDWFDNDEARTEAFTMTPHVVADKGWTIGINPYKAGIGTYDIQLYLDVPGHDYYVSNKLPFDIQSTRYEIVISPSSRITPIEDITEDGTIYDKDGAHVKALFYPTSGIEDLSTYTLEMYKDGELFRTYTKDANSGNFYIVTDDLGNENIRSEFDTGPLDEGSYYITFNMHGLAYNEMAFEVVHYEPVTSLQVIVGNYNLVDNPTFTKTSQPNFVVNLEPTNATAKDYKITVADESVLTISNGKLVPKKAGQTLVTVSTHDITVSGTIKTVDGLASTVYQVEHGNPGIIFVKKMAKAEKNGIKIQTVLNNLQNKKDGLKVYKKDGKEIASSQYSSVNAATFMVIVNGDGTQYKLYIIGESTGAGKIAITSVSKLYSAFLNKINDHVRDQWLFKVMNIVSSDTVLKINDVSKLYSFHLGKVASI